jgi:ABC-type lipoprotein export system ATPase subunit
VTGALVADALVSAYAIEVAYAGTDVIRNVDVVLRRGDDIALVGRSGAGKSTLLLALAGLLPVAAGRVDRQEVARRDIGVVFQSPSLLPDLSVLENVTLPLRLSGDVGIDEARERAVQALRDLDMSMLEALPGELSGGQQQRVAVARVLAARPTVTLADEPTGALDPDTAARVLSALRANRDRTDGALLIATHDDAIATTARTQWHLDDGQLQP